MEATISYICCAQGEGAIDDCTVTKLFKKFCSNCKNLNNQARSAQPKTLDNKILAQLLTHSVLIAVLILITSAQLCIKSSNKYIHGWPGNAEIKCLQYFFLNWWHYQDYHVVSENTFFIFSIFI